MNLPPNMLNRNRSRISPSQLAADRLLRFKLTTLIARHDQMKIAFQQLKSQIQTGLLQAEEVFASLALPLIKLVGLKTVEMAEQGRFSTIRVDTADSPDHGGRRNGVVFESPTVSPDSVRREDRNNLKVGNCVTKATIAGRELVEKQQTQVIQLIQLLRQIEIQVNSRKDNILQTLADHRVSLQKLFRKSVYHLSNLQHRNNDASLTLIMLKLLQGLFHYMGIVFGSVESGVEELMKSLAAHMCNPMVEYVKGLKADMKFGTCMRLLATVEEMEMELRNGRLELEEAKKRIRVAEEGKVEALSKLNETHERVRRLNELLEFLSENKIEPREFCVPYKFLGMEEGQENDDKLLWELLRKRKYKAPESPMGPPQLLSLEPNTKQSKSRSLKSHRAGTWNRTRGLQGPPATRIPLGSSPSAAIQRFVLRKRITP
ncbi:hypothetical protein Ddye_014371 [Dipteronia dyeriana]|uniref:Uncharacterized protein n=1 Tax=Dipteronia dyeriana TaxID=168575 RepID=A0AAD9X855_9ROSI|nr:hypothetical protein Ddye_014371 [Dipteronia dyeriana]